MSTYRILLCRIADEPEFNDAERQVLRAISRGSYRALPLQPDPAGSEPERLLTTKEACGRLGISRTSFYTCGVRDHLTPHFGYTDAHPRYALSEVLALIRSKRGDLRQPAGEVHHAS